MYYFFFALVFVLLPPISTTHDEDVVLENIEALGPGLKPKEIVMPARYFFVYARGRNYTGDSSLEENDFQVQIKGRSLQNKDCRVWVNILNRKDSSLIVRYKLFETCLDLTISVLYKNSHINGSPFKTKGPVQPEDCPCAELDLDTWLKNYECPTEYNQIMSDLKSFSSVDFNSFYTRAINRFNNSHSSSVCHFVVKDNEVYRTCYGQHVGFKMFIDAILLSLTRKVRLPNFEFFSNLGDWPLIPINDKPRIPLFSWCGSSQSADIVLPTYDITESTLECMGRVSLDMLSVQGNIDKTWHEKPPQAFWRGRDSSRERLKLIEIARKHPEIINASLTNFFFFRDEEKIYGPKEKHISFFKFFDYKYQLNLDGTVAAYRFPYLLVGDALVFKQESEYYEHFYKELRPWKHYIPFKTDLSDLVEKIKWAINNDDKAQEIAKAGQLYARNNLLPQHIFCYHAVLFKV
ncbi:hypothetical protein AAG570_001801 [Ranatra chinensis]|uniref:Glycosyl transferase CAP10 domain-containing protein n=1 Tax=Ranatra chinensis TaxID=642074 RepID=A0ABD0Y9L5_9HEMI